MRSCLTGNSGWPVVAVFAFLCGCGFWVLKSRDSNPAKDKHNVEVGEDRISKLPDDVLSSIISRLMAREAARTSILSSRWRHAYTFTTQVKFSCSCFNKQPRYANFHDHKMGKLGNFHRKVIRAVNTILQHHSGSKIMSLDLVCCYGVCISHGFKRWMDSVGRLGVERLRVGLCFPHRALPVFSFDFPPQASSLKHLCLNNVSLRTTNRNALKTLELGSAVITYEVVESLLSNCSSLLSLKFMYCDLPSKLSICGPDLQLQSLTVNHCTKVAEVELHAVNLTAFHVCDSRMLSLSFLNVPLLRILHVEMSRSRVTPYVFEKVAKYLPHLKSMLLSTLAKFLEGIQTVRVIHELSNLRQLDLLLEDPNKLDLLALGTILDACPFLHKFHLGMGKPSTFNGKKANVRVVRPYTQLKQVEFSGFSETKNEYNFIFYILDNAVFLERLTILLNFRSYRVDYGCWLGKNSDDVKKHIRIRNRLQGKAISKNTEIIIA